MGETVQHGINVEEVFDDFRRLAGLNSLIEEHYYSGAASYRRDELVAAIGEKLIGRKVCLIKLPLAGDDSKRVIERLTPGDRARPYSLSERPHPESNRHYVSEGFGYKTLTRGRVEAVDGPRNSLVVRPRGFYGLIGERDWVRMVNADGEPVADLTLLSSKQEGILKTWTRLRKLRAGSASRM
jgi:hypothetical protein